jgi:DNA-binding response OmpR family regulator
MTETNSYSILIAEDDPFLTQSIHQILAEFNVHYKIVHSGKQVIDEYQNDYYDMVLMDILLPDITGFETATKICKSNMHIPIIAFTALEYAEIKNEIADSGINHYVKKPTSTTELRSLLLNYFIVAA